MVAADARTAITFALSPGHAHDAPQGRELLKTLALKPEGLPVLMDRAYEDNQTRQLVLDLAMTPIVPPKSNRVEPWEYDRALYKKRNEVERLFRRLKGYRRIFSRFEKLDVMFLGFVHFTLIADALR
jgi:transposase